jgi:hypothetical protein
VGMLVIFSQDRVALLCRHSPKARIQDFLYPHPSQEYRD